ncbi:hypothetical protein DCS_00622 [Drechmeria coniospora]|uniref:Uncharacterized protein n=1 Tax=Drechmeria coniospora TaxID=98403 RepID=A0A151GR65_DRECN|nr:hypothetical protein DCS_00622 [Drechmeria coniospora]KYK59492.1 hypothetical protein DCS_00622 [Drechmeria coniospora]
MASLHLAPPPPSGTRRQDEATSRRPILGMPSAPESVPSTTCYDTPPSKGVDTTQSRSPAEVRVFPRRSRWHAATRSRESVMTSTRQIGSRMGSPGQGRGYS